MCGAEAVLIDSDHALSAAGFLVQSRVAHSIPFMGFSAVLLGLLTRRTGKPSLVAACTLSACLSHLSFDVLSGDGAFPLLAPLTFAPADLPWSTWPLLQVLAMGVTLAGTLWRRWTLKGG